MALITGSDSGIGQATAIAFAEEGAEVVVHYLHDAEGADKTRAAVTTAGRQAIVVRADVSDDKDVADLFDKAVEALGRVDILVNNAGVDASGKPVAELSSEVWDRAIRTNVCGYFICCCRYVQLRLASGGSGKIINVSSVHADNPNPGGADYDCSEDAIRMLTRTLALQLAEHKINVNSLAPGMVLTPFNQAAIDDPQLEQQVQSTSSREPPNPPGSPN